MWLYKFIHKNSRTQVPSFGTFLLSNHDTIKMWLENVSEAPSQRMNFSLRFLRWIISICLLYLFIYVLIGPEGSYFLEECEKRLECYNACNKAFFPQLSCERQDQLDFYFLNNHYSETYLFSRPMPQDYGTTPLADKNLESWQDALRDYERCKSYILDYRSYEMVKDEPSRQTRTHSCFSYCRNGEDPNFKGDDRPECIEVEPALRDQLICLYPDDTCETTSVSNSLVLGSYVLNKKTVNLTISLEAALVGIIVSNPFQILWDFMTYYLHVVQIDKDNAKHGCLLLAYQCFIAFLFTFILFFSTHLAIITTKSGDSFLIFTTFCLAYIIDQVKQFGTLAVIYLIVVRRFGFLQENEKDFIDPSNREFKNENAIPRLKNCCLKSLEHQYIENLSLLTIGLYSVFILFDLTMSQLFTIDATLLETIDLVFLTVFLIEIILKTFASSGAFLMDGFNLFDATIVIASWALMIQGITFKGLGVLRLIRVVVITIRSITGNKSRLRHSKQTDPVASVITILKQLQELPVSNNIKKEAKLISQIIEENKLYELALDQQGEGQQDLEAKAWLNITTEQANDTTLWFERDLDDFLKELHREDAEIDQHQLEEDEERLRQILSVSNRQWTNILKIMSDFEKWDFDVFGYCDAVGNDFLIHFSFRLFQQYGLLEKFSIADKNFVSLLNSIKNYTYEQNSYHNLTKIVELTHNYHYFVKQGNMMNVFSDLNIMSAFLACFLCDIQHPGVNNSFLIAMKHTKALRYNDKSVLENHHCAIAFKLLLDPQNDVFELLSEAQYWNVRAIIIKMILSSDISNHFDLIMSFKSRTAGKKFPEDNDEDKQLLMNMTLYCSDHAAPTKSHQLYFKWMAVEMEEYYQQGDLEKKLDFSVTPFYDRATCNPFKFQLGYIDVIATPLFESLIEFKSVFRDTLLTDGLEANRRLLMQKIDETKSISDQVDRQQTKQLDGSKEEELNPIKDSSGVVSSPRGKTSKNQVGLEVGEESMGSNPNLLDKKGKNSELVDDKSAKQIKGNKKSSREQDAPANQ